MTESIEWNSEAFNSTDKRCDTPQGHTPHSWRERTAEVQLGPDGKDTYTYTSYGPMLWCHGLEPDIPHLSTVEKINDIHGWLEELMPAARMAMKMMEKRDRLLSWGRSGKRD